MLVFYDKKYVVFFITMQKIEDFNKYLWFCSKTFARKLNMYIDKNL